MSAMQDKTLWCGCLQSAGITYSSARQQTGVQANWCVGHLGYTCQQHLSTLHMIGRLRPLLTARALRWVSCVTAVVQYDACS